MINLSGDVHIWLCSVPTDMHKSFDGSSGMTCQVLKQNTLNGDWFVFVNCCRTMMKVLYFSLGGYCLGCKRLEQGTFASFSQGT